MNGVLRIFREAIESFCNLNGGKQMLVAYLGRGDIPILANEMPETFKKKLIYFLKPDEMDPNAPLDIETLRTKVCIWAYE